jgi:hypothetical protein
MPYTTTTITAGELMRQFNEQCTFEKRFVNDEIGRREIFINFLRIFSLSYREIPNNNGETIIQINCRTSEREFVERAAEIASRGMSHNPSMDWRRHYMQRMVNDAETRFTQEYLGRSPSEITETPQQVNTLVEESI